MSEVQSRGQSSRGRGSFRGGRGGYRGTRGGAKPHSRSEEQDHSPSLEDQGEVGELKAKYADKLPLLREVCEGWSDEDLVFALQETDGDVPLAVDRITTGSISQWGEVKKKTSKPKEAATSSEFSARGRGRGAHEGRGRGRSTERGGRAGRGARAVSQANGTKTSEKPAKITEEAFSDVVLPTSTVSDNKPTNGDTNTDWTHEPGKDQLASLATEEPKPASAAAPTGKARGWAGLFAKPTPPPAPKKAPTPPPAPVAEQAHAPAPEPVSMPVTAHVPEEPAPEAVVEEAPVETMPPPIDPIQVEETSSDLPLAPHPATPTDIAPSQDRLTEKNLDKLPDTSHPPQSITVASTTASTQDPLNPIVSAVPVVRPGMSGFAASALKATTSTGRSASYSRKLMDQQEAVVMPGNHAVDRAAVQFGKMGLNGGEDIDADEDREEPETRTQLPDDSPAAPRASLPPAVPETKAPVEAAAAVAPVVEDTPPPRQAPGLPPAPQQPQQPSPQQSASYAEQYARYNQGQQKNYDPFTQQPQAQSGSSEPFSNQVPGHSQVPGSGQDYSQYYGNRDAAYQGYYSGYGQVHDNQRGASGAFSTSAQDTQAQYATARPQGSYGQSELQNSGNNTPNPTAAGTAHQAQPSQHVPGQSSYGGHPYGYPSAYGQQYPQYGSSYMNNMNHRYGANRPMFDDVRRENDYYGSQYGYGHNQQYGGNYKSGMYGQPQHQYSHDYSSSPANTSGFGGREAGYGRTGSAQPSESQQSNSAANNAFGGGMPDPFGRTPSGFGQTQGHNSHQGSEEQTKASGPSPSLQGGRPGSALNNMASQQGGLPHQSQHSNQGFGGYPQYAGFGNQSHQNSGYGNYGSNAAFGGYGYSGGRGWTGGYGGGQH